MHDLIQSNLNFRWSRIAKFLPGRTDNEIKNYWRSRVVKHAKQLKYDVNSVELREFVRDIWLPRLSEKIHASKCSNINLGNGMTNYDVAENAGPEALQMDCWANQSNSISSDQIVEAHHIAATGYGFYDSMSCELNFGQQCYGLDSFQGSQSPLWFSYGELSNMLLNGDLLTII